jgi:hypothetical protein
MNFIPPPAHKRPGYFKPLTFARSRRRKDRRAGAFRMQTHLCLGEYLVVLAECSDSNCEICLFRAYRETNRMSDSVSRGIILQSAGNLQLVF